jgi:diguanylate cyclase (GGDEF)-like protein
MRTILVAEDDPVSRRLIEAKLAKWGYNTISVTNGADALARLTAADSPQLAILDWMMPEMDGVQVCSEIRKRGDTPYTYLILLTAKSQKADIVQGLNAGADDYITKPFDAHELESRVLAGSRILDLQNELLSVREELRERATHDYLTGLPNRLLFGDRLTQKLAEASRRNSRVCVMFLDIDRFKVVNDGLGHQIGDQLLTQLASRLTKCVRDEDTVARMGGDEFTIILSDVESTADAIEVAERVLSTCSTPFDLDDEKMHVSLSIGLSFYPNDGTDIETLVKSADAAMYRAKEGAGNGYVCFTQDLEAESAVSIEIESSLRHALERDQFVLHYQPRVGLVTGKVLGVEALIRWQHPELGLLYPDDFISIAERTGLIMPIGEWVLRTACMQNMAWQKAGIPPMEIAVNVSARQFEQGDLLGLVKRTLRETGLAPEYLGLELTESTVMHHVDCANSIMSELKAMGVRVYIDDFGTGHSSLSYLKHLPADIVKIDKSFVKDITSDPDSAAIAGAIIAMAHRLNLSVVAEGVETLDQLDFLTSMNCDEMQGYFVSRPVAPESLLDILRQEPSRRKGELPFAA